MSLIDLRNGKFLLNFFDRIPDERLDRFTNWQREIIGLWGGRDALMSLPMNVPALLSQVNPASDKGPNDYRDTFVAAGLGDVMSLGLARDEGFIGSCVFGRARSAAKFADSDLALARLILPRAQRAMEFSRKLQLASLRAHAQLDIALGAPDRMLRLLPLPHDTLRGTLTGSASAAIVLTASPARPLEEAEVVDILIGRHDLTPMEAAVTVQIAKGDGRAAAAERLGIRENTVRTHLSAIFLKLGLNRQAQRVQFVTGLSRDE